MRALAAGLLVGIAACGSSSQPHDPVDAGPCWPLPSMPGGQVTMGTGDVAYEPMTSVLQITQSGAQSDPYLEIHSRMTGMPPGDPNDALNPKNPHTKVTAFIPDLNKMMGQECPASLGYVATSQPDTFDMVHSLRLGFGTYADAQTAMGKTVMITVEVVGSNGLYAMDQRTVTLGSLNAR